MRVSQAWGRASIAFIANQNAATYYTNTTPACPQAGTTQCGYPSDVWGWAVLGGAEIKLDMLSPGSRVGFFGTYGVGASRLTRNSQTSPGLYGSGNQIAFGILTDAVYVNGGSLEQTTTWAAGGGFEYFWTRNFSSTIYGGYTRTEYNGTASTLICDRVGHSGACDPNYNLWQIGTHHDWFPLPGLRFAVDVLYTGVDRRSPARPSRSAKRRAPVRPASIRPRISASPRSCSAPSAPGAAATDRHRQSGLTTSPPAVSAGGFS